MRVAEPAISHDEVIEIIPKVAEALKPTGASPSLSRWTRTGSSPV
jgi:hypothetical protein